ncbi:phosphoketolase [Lentilactobacillus farraginis]|uniref:D-xylulose 5-phosphate D-fructose 6-phosphate phosphoketolase n=1 Tax=Lentilactobacillus farraginis DSM 18382 = JCM 14108 TaxID=1423743 RepID=X0PBQ4_9LACO|nr:phosphoketolase family protein [Lentilactobacillus farraginis]KRM08184.1 D-xylulose 5-phosphate D-fructose 6-phosphate phosphoketolase [Lentilactobacillus farraginis DSM 18382 = JCM 14108]GAF37413.1 xylulose-5-phosphate phosphoketolase [Lentilactobacillus farraginis DSM 18382 = JCM 14108]
MPNYDSDDYLRKVNLYWQAANYLSVGQLFLRNNPLLKRPLVADDVKIKPIGHWGTIASQNFMYAHLNRVIKKYDLNMFYIEGSGHGGQVMVSNSYLDGSYSEIYPKIPQNETGLQRLFKQFSFPGGIASHAAPETPGSMHEGGELGYSISHGTGAILDNPDVIAAVEIGDGEAETGPLAASWFSNKFINPIGDGAVLPMLNLNGFKISNPTILSRMSDQELTSYFEGLGWQPYFVETDGDPKDYARVHKAMAVTMDTIILKIKTIQRNARDHQDASLPHWPMLILRSPKGWTGPKTDLAGNPIENSFRAHQVPIPVTAKDMTHKDMLVTWLKSYHPNDLFNQNGSIKQAIRETTPNGNQRMAMNPITNGGIAAKKLTMPNPSDFALKIKQPGALQAQDTEVLSHFYTGIMKQNPTTFRAFGPDETKSNRFFSMLDYGKRQWLEPIKNSNDENMANEGRTIDSQLSEHQAEGWLEGYVLSGRHGFFASYEAFTRVIDSMLTQHYKWLRKASEQSWRNDYPSLNIMNVSHAFQQDHNGYTHQDPGMLGHLAEKGHELVNEYIPADANSLLAVMNTALQSREKINLIVASKHPRPQWFSIDEATKLVDHGLGIVPWASNDQDDDPDIIFATAGTEATMESLAAIDLLHQAFPKLKVRFINIVDILKLRPANEDQDRRGLTNVEFDKLFTTTKPVILAFHGFENTFRGLVYHRHNHNISFHGYRENGDITTPFDMRVLNELDRYHLAKDAVSRTKFNQEADSFKQQMDHMLQKHHDYIRKYGTDIPEVQNWQWSGALNHRTTINS